MFDYSLMSDEELVSLCRKNDEEAWTQLYSRYCAISKVIALKIKNSKIENDDLVQEGLIGFLAAVHSFNAEKNVSFKTYAWTCIRNKMLNAVSHSKAKKFVSSNDCLSLSEELEIESDEMNIEESIIAKNNALQISKIISEKLTKRERDVLRLYINAKTYDAIAAELSISKKAVDGALQRAKLKLKSELDVQ